MTLTEITTELTKINTAIDSILAGAQSYSIAGRNVTRADLKALYERKKELETMKSRLSSGGGAIRYPIFGIRG